MDRGANLLMKDHDDITPMDLVLEADNSGKLKIMFQPLIFSATFLRIIISYLTAWKSIVTDVKKADSEQITLSVPDGKTFTVAKSLLVARSDYFKTLFSSDMKDAFSTKHVVQVSILPFIGWIKIV